MRQTITNFAIIVMLTACATCAFAGDVPQINSRKPPGPVPKGMVWVPGGWFWMGEEQKKIAKIQPNTNFPIFDTNPVHKVYVDGFWMDQTEVTNEQWAKFAKATGYKTVAEKKPRLEDFAQVIANAPKEIRPKLIKELQKPFSICFKIPQPGRYSLRQYLGWWELKRGADWKHPEGPDSNIKGREKHPVVHIAFEDAVAYCKWAKKRLPTEAEWEFAVRGGLNRKMYCWGDELTPQGTWMANIWQGNFPVQNTKKDGYVRTAPVGSFRPNGYRLHDMAGNVWEWCSDFYRPDYYKNSPQKNPKGPKSGFDPAEPGVSKRVQRGGSYLCADNYCIRYLVAARGKGEPTSSQNHCGFRCVLEAK